MHIVWYQSIGRIQREEKMLFGDIQFYYSLLTQRLMFASLLIDNTDRALFPICSI